MGRLVRWNVRAGALGLRLLVLHVLWLGWTLRGGVVLGLAPATAALHAVLRTAARADDLLPEEVPDLRALRVGFREAWHRELWPANRLGAVLAVLWAVVLVDRAVVTHLDLGGLGPVLAGAHTVLGVVLGVVTVLVWPLQAHFDEGALALLRRAAVMVLGRPAVTAMTAAAVGLVLYAYVVLPGLVPVLGVVAPATLATACLWRTGVLAADPVVGAAAGRTASPALAGSTAR